MSVQRVLLQRVANMRNRFDSPRPELKERNIYGYIGRFELRTRAIFTIRCDTHACTSLFVYALRFGGLFLRSGGFIPRGLYKAQPVIRI